MPYEEEIIKSCFTINYELILTYFVFPVLVGLSTGFFFFLIKSIYDKITRKPVIKYDHHTYTPFNVEERKRKYVPLENNPSYFDVIISIEISNPTEHKYFINDYTILLKKPFHKKRYLYVHQVLDNNSNFVFAHPLTVQPLDNKRKISFSLMFEGVDISFIKKNPTLHFQYYDIKNKKEVIKLTKNRKKVYLLNGNENKQV